MASAIAEEARAIYATGTKGLTFWSPVVEPVRDPRWGRTGESYGEDPFLAAEIARGFVRGMMCPLTAGPAGRRRPGVGVLETRVATPSTGRGRWSAER